MNKLAVRVTNGTEATVLAAFLTVQVFVVGSRKVVVELAVWLEDSIPQDHDALLNILNSSNHKHTALVLQRQPQRPFGHPG